MTGRIFITGDKHGTLLPIFGLAEKNQIRDTDLLIIAGDAGYVWDKSYPYVIHTLEQIFPGTIAFVDGNHENHTLLNQLPTAQWYGGRVHPLGERVCHFMRGELYEVYGKHIFTFGGARSNDKDRREEEISWWKTEEPSEKEILYSEKQFLENMDTIDFVITHETPLFARSFISRSKPIEEDYFLPALLEDWYKKIEAKANFKKWYFGHMHVDQSITPKLRAVHHDILLLGEEKKIPWA